MPRWRTKKLHYANNAREYTSKFGTVIGETPEGLPTFNGRVLGALLDKEKRKKSPLDEEIKGFSVSRTYAASLPSAVDLREWDTPIFDQGSLGSCVANAACGVFQWLQKKRTGGYFEGSRLFVYKEARDHDGSVGDVGSFNGSAIWVLRTEGVCHENLWPYNPANVDVEPPQVAFQDAYANKATQTYQADGGGEKGQALIDNARAAMQNFPTMMGFPVYENFGTDVGGRINYPAGAQTGGHAMCCMGYDDGIQNINGSYGAILMRNSWGTGWGNQGYGWMGYDHFGSASVGANDLYVVTAESNIPEGPVTPEPGRQPTPGGANVAGGLGIDVYQYLAKSHNGMATAGLHKIEIFPVDGKAVIDMSVRVRRCQEGLQ